MSIVTRHGDTGETGLLYGGRVHKDDAHTEAYGAIDEAVSALGLARAHAAGTPLGERLLTLQRQLFTAGAELATARGHRPMLEKHFDVITEATTMAIDREITDLEDRVRVPQAFVLPGGTVVSAALDLARTDVRRAERRAVSLARAGDMENPEVLRYLNRVSDLLFMLAREAEEGATIAR